jgi:hypothetical protein
MCEKLIDVGAPKTGVFCQTTGYCGSFTVTLRVFVMRRLAEGCRGRRLE